MRAKRNKTQNRFRVRQTTRAWVCRGVPLLVGLATSFVFSPTLQNEFVEWDDDKNFLTNLSYRGLGSSQLEWMFTTFHMGLYIPLTWMTFGLDYLMWGMNPVGYHLTGLLLHAANAVIFYFVAIRLIRVAMRINPDVEGLKLGLAGAFAALLFALHPLRVESVAWATERRDVLSGLFYLLSILLYLRRVEKNNQRWYWASLGSFVLALLSKPMAVSLPVVLLLLDIYPLRRLGGGMEGWIGIKARKIVIEKSPFILLSLIAGVIALRAMTYSENLASITRLGWLERVAISIYSLAFYLWKTVVPINLSPLYELPQRVDPAAWPYVTSGVVVLAITGLAIAVRRRYPALLTVWIVYIVILFPVAGIVQNGPQIAADRYTYLASLGLAILGGAGVISFWLTWERKDVARPLALFGIGVAVSMFATLGVLTWNQVRVWRNSETLWGHTLSVQPTVIGHTNFGAYLFSQGKLTEAIKHYQHALLLRPNHSEALYNLGVALARQDKFEEAIEQFQRAVRSRAGFADAHNYWGLVLAREGRHREAIEQFQAALRVKRNVPRAHYNWGLALAQQGKADEAIEHFREALRIDPDFAEAHNNWGVALADQGRWEEAVLHFQQALGIRPGFADARSNLEKARAFRSGPNEYPTSSRMP